jgi:uncharacterized repeat protein (TIGR02543 family)
VSAVVNHEVWATNGQNPRLTKVAVSKSSVQGKLDAALGAVDHSSYEVSVVNLYGKVFHYKTHGKDVKSVSVPNLHPSVYTVTVSAVDGAKKEVKTSKIFVNITEKNSDYAKKFSDLGKLTADRANSVRWMYRHAITSGSPAGSSTYKPSDVVNRGAMAQFMRKLVGSVGTDKTPVNPKDISRLNADRKDDIRWLATEQITVLSSGKYNPQNPVNRGAMAEFMYKLAGSPGALDKSVTSKKHHVDPATVTAEAAKFKNDKELTKLKSSNPNRYYAVLWLARNKVTLGSNAAGTLYSPQNPVNRGAMAQFMQKLYDYVLLPAHEHAKASASYSYTAHVVNFVPDNGSAIDKQIVVNNSKVQAPKTPDKSGYDFVTWHTNASLGNAYDFGAPVTKDLTLYAEWSAIKNTDTNTDYLRREQFLPTAFLEIENTVRADITEITFTDAKPAICPADYANGPIDAGHNATGDVLACTSSDYKRILIGQDGGVRANPISDYLFTDLFSAPQINGLADKTRDWDKVIYMYDMFMNFGKGADVEEVKLPDFPKDFGRNATDLGKFFMSYAEGSTAQTITLPKLPDGFGSGVGTSLVSMFYFFGKDTVAKKITLPEFPVGFGQEAETTSDMFHGFMKNSKAEEIALPAFPDGFGEGIERMGQMFFEFAADSAATKIVVPDFPDKFGSSALTLSDMFCGFARNAAATTIIMPKEFPAGFGNETENTRAMFTEYFMGTNVSTITLPKFPDDFGRNATIMNFMFFRFAYNSKATSINFPDFPEGFGNNAENMNDMFNAFCTTITPSLQNDIAWNHSTLSPDNYLTMFYNASMNGRKFLVPAAADSQIPLGGSHTPMYAFLSVAPFAANIIAYQANYVLFDKGDNGIGDETQLITYNRPITSPPQMSKPGRVFDGWYLGNVKWDFQRVVTTNMVLEARWL